jgi:8-oxo-dGTP pyrophosphatase MutT (NUDIX family)/phosphohistidine phosphatase SixA
MGAPAEIIAAGAVVFRKGPEGREVLLVHRPKYDDWSFPKGKLDLGEHVVTAAVREVAEETGLDVRLGPPLTTQRYTVRNGEPKSKNVHYWVGYVVGGDDVASYRPNDEIDQVVWLPVEHARDRLSYPYDVKTLDESAALKKSNPLVILRHSRARSRKSWHGDDRDRLLTKAGEFQAEQIAPVLAAYGVVRVLSSSSRRCWSTLAPYADLADLDIEVTDDLTEEEADGTTVSEHVERLLAAGEPAVLCTHRPVLPLVFEALALQERKLEPGDLLVAHHRRGRVIAVEHQQIPFR